MNKCSVDPYSSRCCEKGTKGCITKHNPTRLDMGEAWMWCKDCGAKLYSFDNFVDGAISCPYKDEHGRCNPK